MEVTLVADVLAAFQLGAAQTVESLGGTATPKWCVTTDGGRLVVRVRPAEFSEPNSVAFDHSVLAHLAAANLPVPCPRRRPNGETVLWRDGHAVEVLNWIEGEAFPAGDVNAAYELGAFLARFHTALSGRFPSGKETVRREDHPDLIEPYLTSLLAAASETEQKHGLERIGEQLRLVRRDLDTECYPNLPRAVIHGDMHPGNVRFSGVHVAAVYDFDYLSVQARARDVADALMFFASTRMQRFDTDQIRSLTQPFVPELELCRAVLSGYQAQHMLTDVEWSALPLLMRSRWLQIRVRGSRKVPPAEKAAFVLKRFFEVTDWLDRSSQAFFEKLRNEAT